MPRAVYGHVLKKLLHSAFFSGGEGSAHPQQQQMFENFLRKHLNPVRSPKLFHYPNGCSLLPSCVFGLLLMQLC